MDPQQRIAELEAQLAAMQTNETAKKKRAVELKVSQKGCVQINGIRKFPFTFYKEEIRQILSMANKIEEFITDNDDSLKESSVDWLAYNTNKSAEWPNITEKQDPYPEYEKYQIMEDRIKFLDE